MNDRQDRQTWSSHNAHPAHDLRTTSCRWPHRQPLRLHDCRPHVSLPRPHRPATCLPRPVLPPSCASVLVLPGLFTRRDHVIPGGPVIRRSSFPVFARLLPTPRPSTCATDSLLQVSVSVAPIDSTDAFNADLRDSSEKDGSSSVSNRRLVAPIGV